MSFEVLRQDNLSVSHPLQLALIPIAVPGDPLCRKEVVVNQPEAVASNLLFHCHHCFVPQPSKPKVRLRERATTVREKEQQQIGTSSGSQLHCLQSYIFQLCSKHNVFNLEVDMSPSAFQINILYISPSSAFQP